LSGTAITSWWTTAAFVGCSILDWQHLSPDVLQSRRQKAQRAPLPAPPLDRPLTLPLEPTTLAQRLAQALGPERLLLRFRTYREYPTEEQARWRIIELLQVGFRPRRVDGPAIIERNPKTGVATCEEWWLEGKLHRTDDSADIERDPTTNVVIREEWCLNGDWQRKDMPSFSPQPLPS
jgi:hypothetical protein